MQARVLIHFLATAVALVGCAPKPGPLAESAPPSLPPHLGPAPARLCTVAPFHVADGGTVSIAVQVSNEGGYCAVSLTAASGQPFDAPLVPVAPLHGTIRAIKYNHRNNLEYVPETGYSGPDSFIARMIVKGVPGYTTLNVKVAVQGAT